MWTIAFRVCSLCPFCCPGLFAVPAQAWRWAGAGPGAHGGMLAHLPLCHLVHNRLGFHFRNTRSLAGMAGRKIWEAQADAAMSVRACKCSDHFETWIITQQPQILLMSPLTTVLIGASYCTDLPGIFKVATSFVLLVDAYRAPHDLLLASAILGSVSSCWLFFLFLIFGKMHTYSHCNPLSQKVNYS